MRTLSQWSGIVAAALLAGCGSLTSLECPQSLPQNSKPVSTTSYYLPRGFIQIAGAPEKNNRFEVTVSEALQPETSRPPFYLKFDPSWFVNDYYRVQVSPKGLLQSVVFMDANLNWNVIAQGALSPATLSFPNSKGQHAFSAIIDPFDPHAIAAFNENAGQAFHLKIKVPPPMQLPSRSKDGAYAGVVFHPTIPIVVSLKAGAGEQQTVLPIPDPRVTLAFKTDRGFFDERGTDVEFMDGLLTTVHITHESIITVILGIPKNLIEDVIPLPPGW